MNNKELRKEISKILVKWSMPTRQVAINDIMALFPLYGEWLLGEDEALPSEALSHLREVTLVRNVLRNELRKKNKGE